MSPFLLLAVCLVAGIILRITKRLPKDAPASINGLIIYLSLPALILLEIHRAPLAAGIFFPVASAWILFALSAIGFALVGRALAWERRKTGTLILMGGLGNTSFVGYPLLEALYGSDSLKTGMLVDQLGTFPVAATLGIFVGSIYSGRKASARQILRRVLSFPPMYALVLAFALRSWEFPEGVAEVLGRIGSTTTPLALVSVGLQLNPDWKVFQAQFLSLAQGLFFKLFLGPACIAWLYWKATRLNNEVIQVSIVECAMAPMITAAVLVGDFDLDSELASLMIGIGIPLSLITVPLWAHGLRV